MEATLIENRQGVVSIVDRGQVQAAKDGLLTVGGLKILIVRGGDTNQTVGMVYREFMNRTDQTDERFRFSRSKRGLVEQDPIWGQTVRVTPTAMENYVKKWFILGELLYTAVGEVIIIVTELPKMSVNLWQQNRYIGQQAPLFDFID
jgi:hypothetical protein